jgi:hypothetical protein
MSPLFVVAALAQAATTGGSAAPRSTDPTASKVSSGESNYVDLEAGVGYSSNPLLSIANDQGSAFGRVSLHAVHSRVSTRSTTLLSAYAEDVSYTNHHGSQQSASVYGRHDAAVSEHVRLFVDANAAYEEGGQLDTRVLGVPIIPPPIPGGLVTPPILIPPAGDFLSVTGSEYSFGGHGGGTFALSPRDSLSLSSGIDHVVFHNGLTRTAYTKVPGALSYDRQLTARTTVGARVTAESTDYDGPASLRVISPQVTARTLLSPTITLDGAVGVAFARIKNGLVTRDTTGLSAQANLCGQGETSFFCAVFSVDEQAATTAGPARSIGGSVDYTKRLDSDQTISFSLGATHYSTPVSVLPTQTFSAASYYHAAASYSRKFATRLFGGVNLSAREVTRNGPDPKADISASLFLRYRFGDLQ